MVCRAKIRCAYNAFGRDDPECVQCDRILVPLEVERLDTNEAREIVSTLPIISTLRPTPAELAIEVLMNISSLEDIPSGTTLFTKGDDSIADGIVLLKGEVSVIKDDFPEIVAAAPELLGEMGRLNPTAQRTATVAALTDLTILRFTWAAFTKEAGRLMSETELEKMSSALQEYAWQHFIQ